MKFQIKGKYNAWSMNKDLGLPPKGAYPYTFGSSFQTPVHIIRRVQKINFIAGLASSKHNDVCQHRPSCGDK
jgi:hypothetical protein